ncbi:phage tail assembly protein [Myxococcota bacterium]|nr:phage tail assembly protein [Myxococcota bacterium]
MSDPKPRTKTIPLDFPVEREGGEITELVIRRPKAKDLALVEEVRAKGEGVEEAIALLAILSGQPVEVIEEIDFEDFTRASEALADFFPQGKA